MQQLVEHLRPRAQVRTADEFGGLAQDLNHFLDRITQVVSDLDRILAEVLEVMPRIQVQALYGGFFAQAKKGDEDLEAIGERMTGEWLKQAGAEGQARHVFLGGNGLPERWQGRDRFVVLETGFGLGNNFLATWAAWRSRSPRCATCPPAA